MSKQRDDLSTLYSKELRLLIYLLGTSLDTNQRFPDDIQFKQINWNKFLELVKHHRVKGQVYQAVQQLSPGIPAEVISSLKSLSKTNGIKALKNTAEIYHLNKLLKQEKIPVILFKGVSLSKQLYGNTGFRHTGDIDFLVKDNDIDKVDRILQQIGYSRIFPAQDLTPKQLKSFIKHHHHFEYIHKGKNIRLEAHWAFFFNKQIYHFDSNRLFNNSVEVSISENTFYTLPQEENIIYLITHGALHGFFRLFWLYDIAYMYNFSKDIDWDKIYRAARKAGLERVFKQAFHLINILWSIPVPEFISAEKQSFSVKYLVNTVLQIINYGENHFDGTAAERLQKNFYQIIAKRGIWYKLSPLTRQFTSYHDWGLIKFPDKLFFLYYIFRPFFIIAALLKKDYFKKD